MSRGWILVLAQDHRRAKSRLAAVLKPEQRSRLARAMLEDVIAAVGRRGPRWRALVVTESDDIATLARRRGLEVLRLSRRGTRATAAAALALADAAGCTEALVLAADLPLANSSDIDELLAAAQRADVLIVPDRRREGTNALFVRPPLALRPRFGAGSFLAHVEAAKAAGLRWRTVTPRGLRLDVDTADDLALVRRARRVGRHTAAALRASR